MRPAPQQGAKLFSPAARPLASGGSTLPRGGATAAAAATALTTARERRAAVERLDPELLAELREAFQLFDGDEDGSIDASELKAAFKALGVDVHKADVRRMLAGARGAARVGAGVHARGGWRSWRWWAGGR